MARASAFRNARSKAFTLQALFMDAQAKIYVAGHTGMVGGAIFRALQAKGFTQILTIPSGQLDLRNQAAVSAFFEQMQPAYVFMAAARVGGIQANNLYRAQFLYDNLMMEANVIHAAWQYGVKKLLFLGSSCIYPKMAPQPLKEEYLLTGPLEPTNEPYAIAKIAGIKLCEAYHAQYGANFISAMPTNLYGLGDNYHPENSHVLPALIRRIHQAKVAGKKEVVLWGTGTPRREFMYADDLADACLHLMEHYSGNGFVNVGVGHDLSIAELAQLIADVIGYKGSFSFDTSKPDGTPRKLMDVSLLHSLGWKHKTELKTGIAYAYADYLKRYESNQDTNSPG